MRYGRLSAVGAAAAGLALIATPAFAASVTVGLGGSTATANQSITATAKGDTILTANGNTLTCSGSTLGGTVHGGTGIDPVANLTAAGWTGCNFIGLSASVTVTSPNWLLHANSGYTSGASDVVNGTLTNISGVHVVINGPFGDCEFDVAGDVAGTFDEDNGKGGQELTVSSSNLTVSNVDNAFTCLGLVGEGDPATFSGSYNLNTAAGYINIQ